MSYKLQQFSTCCTGKMCTREWENASNILCVLLQHNGEICLDLLPGARTERARRLPMPGDGLADELKWDDLRNLINEVCVSQTSTAPTWRIARPLQRAQRAPPQAMLMGRARWCRNSETSSNGMAAPTSACLRCTPHPRLRPHLRPLLPTTTITARSGTRRALATRIRICLCDRRRA